MKIYIAARFSRITEMAEFADRLTAAGHEITARWVYGGEEGLTLEQISDLDVEDVVKADMVLSWTEPVGSYNRGGGRHTEFGIGMALNKHLWLVGPREQIFHNDTRVRQFDHLDEVINELKVMDELSRTKVGTGPVAGTSNTLLKKAAA